MATAATVTKTIFAELVGVSPGRISQLIAQGLPVEDDGRIHVARGKEWIRDNIDETRRRMRVEPAGQANEVRANKDRAEAVIAQLKARQLAGELIDRHTALRVVEARARFERDAWIGWVNRAAPEIARVTRADLAQVVALLDQFVREQLATLAATPLEDLEG